MNAKTAMDESRHQQLRELGHDVKSDLSVVSMGLEALETVRDDAEQFEKVLDTIRRGGVQRLQESVNSLIAFACDQ